MSVLIKGMRLPEYCAECVFWNGVCCAAKSDDGFYGTLVKDTNIKPDWCPLEEVTEDDMR